MSPFRINEYAENEVKFLDIDVDDIKKRLINLGAKKVYEGPRKRVYFDDPNRIIGSQSRVSITVEDKVKLEYAETREDKTVATIKVFVSREKEITDFLCALGFKPLFAIISYRISYEIAEEKVDFDLDFWPKLPPFLELDVADDEKLEKYTKALGLNPLDAKKINTRQIYEHYKVDIADVSNESIDLKVDDSLDHFLTLYGTGIGQVSINKEEKLRDKKS